MKKKNYLWNMLTIMMVALFSVGFSACGGDDDDDYDYDYDYNEPTGGSSALATPTGVTAKADGSTVYLSWNAVYNATGYNIYHCNTATGYYSFKGYAESNSKIFTQETSGTHYYKIMAINEAKNTYSDYSAYVYVNIDDSNSGGGDNTGGNSEGGNSQQKPSAPTGVSVSNEGNAYIPDVRVRWNPVSNATSYYIYKSSSANGSYSKIGENTYTSFYDSNPPTNGASAYYKVKAVNSAGESAFSDYAKYTSEKNDEAYAPAYTYGNCTVSGNTMTLRWTYKSGTGYGKATEAVLRVWNPYAEEWQDTQLSASATSTSFNISTKIDNSGYVKAGIVVSNAKGSFTAGSKIYDTKSKKWIN